ncbi:uncharacterized protein B0H64DRAFT_40222 [Chaetomium fimeti]|uniref:Uncharacterized protein n=1 Tax=Chaetomium fimeti TaxID=1854472 RepID=A0AAE0HS96_9PEZI|nr:hypothetical protein B0H64DRAFT_40222 [Chaetomium fimeti]
MAVITVAPSFASAKRVLWADGGAERALRWSMQFDSYLPMAGRESTYFFLWQLSRLMEGKFRRRDDWVLRAGVCLTAGAPGWDVAWFGMVGGVAAAEDHGLYTASRNGPRSRLGMVFKGRELGSGSASGQVGQACVCPSRTRKSEDAPHDRERAVEPTYVLRQRGQSWSTQRYSASERHSGTQVKATGKGEQGGQTGRTRVERRPSKRHRDARFLCGVTWQRRRGGHE